MTMDNKYNKPIRPIDYLPEEPYVAIRESCHEYDVQHVMWELPLWFYISLSHEASQYDTLEERVIFIEFYLELRSFLEAAYLFYKRKVDDPDKKPTKEQYQPQYLGAEGINDPMIFIRQFCHKFPLLYVRIELWDFFQAVQFYEGPLKEGIYKYATSCLHMHILTLVESFYQIAWTTPC